MKVNIIRFGKQTIARHLALESKSEVKCTLSFEKFEYRWISIIRVTFSLLFRNHGYIPYMRYKC